MRREREAARYPDSGERGRRYVACTYTPLNGVAVKRKTSRDSLGGNHGEDGKKAGTPEEIRGNRRLRSPMKAFRAINLRKAIRHKGITEWEKADMQSK